MVYWCYITLRPLTKAWQLGSKNKCLMEKKFCPIDVHAMSSGLSCPWRYIIWKINSSLLSVDVCWIKVTKTYHTEETQKEPKQIFFTFVNGLNKCIKLFEIRKNIIALKCFWLTIRKLRSFFAIESDFCYLLPGVKIIFTKEHSWCYLCAEIKLTNCCAQTITISVRSFCEKLWNNRSCVLLQGDVSLNHQSMLTG